MKIYTRKEKEKVPGFGYWGDFGEIDAQAVQVSRPEALLDAFHQVRDLALRGKLPLVFWDEFDSQLDGQALGWLRHFLAPMQEWSRRHATKFRIQGYGIPPATISSNAGVDLPEGEGARWTALTSSRWASSVGHLFGKPVISSETWTWLHSPVFRATPLDLKAEADRHFLQGVNQLIGHGWPYTAEGVGSTRAGGSTPRASSTRRTRGGS